MTRGTIVQLEPARLLQHTLAHPTEAAAQSRITYRFTEHAGQTRLEAREEVARPISDADYGDGVAGWQAALQLVKQIAEAR